MEVQFFPRQWTTSYEVITVGDGDAPPPKCRPCSQCNVCLGGKEYFSWNGLKYCWDCFDRVHGQKCVLCRKSITGVTNVTFIYFNGRTWHRECFRCTRCKASLDGPLGSLQDDGCIECTRCGAHLKFESG